MPFEMVTKMPTTLDFNEIILDQEEHDISYDKTNV